MKNYKRNLTIGIALIIAGCVGLTPAILGGLPVVIGLAFTFCGTVKAIEAHQ